LGPFTTPFSTENGTTLHVLAVQYSPGANAYNLFWILDSLFLVLMNIFQNNKKSYNKS